MKKLLSDRNNGAFSGRFAAVCVALTVVATFMMSCDDEDTDRSSDPANGHEWVDLGLSVRWATCNVGASLPSGYGDYFAWGETSTKPEYTWGNSQTWDKNVGDISGNPEYDAARANWGGSWRIPDKREMEELVNFCTWEWTTVNGRYGYKVIGSNGNSIFLPAGGFRGGPLLYSDGIYGYYWCSTPDRRTPWDHAYTIELYSNIRRTVKSGYRSDGFNIRPVLDWNIKRN